MLSIKTQDAYVVGCGQSLKKFDWSLLKNKTTIAVNGALINVPEADVFVTADSAFACRAAQNKFWKSKAYKVLVMGRDHANFKRVQRYLSSWDHRVSPARFDGNIGFSESDFATGQNSGFCGMQLAVILGARRIHLLGVDLCGDDAGNYHGLYCSNPQKWEEFLEHFRTAILILQRRGIEVVNHSPVSKLVENIGYEPVK